MSPTTDCRLGPIVRPPSEKVVAYGAASHSPSSGLASVLEQLVEFREILRFSDL